MTTQTGTRNALRTLTSGLAFGESPRWHDGRLYFVDFGAQQVGSVDLEGSRELVQRTPHMPMGIDFLPNGQLVVVLVHENRIVGTDGRTYTDLSTISAKRWGEMIPDGRGNAYVGNIGFDFPGGEFAPGCIALVALGGAVQTVADGLAFPNGMAVTPDNRTLIAAESHGEQLTAFDIAADGRLSQRRGGRFSS